MNPSRRTATAVVAGVLVVVLAGAGSCSGTDSKKGAQQTGQAQTEQAFAQQQAAVPYPADALKDSLERRNLKERLLRYNQPSKISYIYLLSQTGGIYAYFTIKGKVSSTQSQMTTGDLIQRYGGNDGGNVTVQAPGDDGSYGLNEDGVFFFTLDGVMVTWNGPYLLTDAPLRIDTAKLVLQYVDGSKPSSTGGK